MLLPLFLLINTYISVLHGFMPEPDLTNSIYNPRGGIEPIDYDNEGSNTLVELEKSSENVEEPSMSPYRKMTFRRRNINSGSFLGSSGLSPFSRMAYKSAYGSNRGSSFYRNRLSNYGGSMGTFPTSFSSIGDSYNPRKTFQSGLLRGNSRNMGYYGSLNAMRNKYKSRPLDSYSKNAYGTNDLMSSFSTMPNEYGAKPFIPSLGNAGSFIPSVPDQNRFPSNVDYMSPFDGRLAASLRRESDPFKSQISSNNWSGTFRSPSERDEAILDGYADASKKVAKL